MNPENLQFTVCVRSDQLRAVGRLIEPRSHRRFVACDLQEHLFSKQGRAVESSPPPVLPFSGAFYQRETLQRRCRNGQKAQRLPAQQPIYLHVADTITHENIQWCGVIFSTAAFTSSQLSIQSVIHSASVDTLRMYLLSIKAVDINVFIATRLN